MCPLKTRKSTGKDRYRPAHLINNALFDVFVFKILQMNLKKCFLIRLVPKNSNKEQFKSGEENFACEFSIINYF